jgi:hypothetical protein
MRVVVCSKSNPLEPTVYYSVDCIVTYSLQPTEHWNAGRVGPTPEGTAKHVLHLVLDNIISFEVLL